MNTMGYWQDIKCVASSHLPWDKLSGKNILVTGASGLIGSCIVEVLMSRSLIDYDVYASGRNMQRLEYLFGNYNQNGKLHFVQHDVTKPLLLNTDFHFIIAAASGANPKLYAVDPVGVMKANFMGVDNLMQYGKEHHLEKFVFISSGEVYGEGDGRVFSENYSGYVDCASVRACYPSSKRAAETLCIAYGEQFHINVSIARLSHIYGPHFTDSDTRVYAQFIRNIIREENIVMKSTGSQFRSWCYIVDCASAILHILMKGEPSQAYNVADEDSNISIKELAEKIAQIGQKKVVMDIPDEIERKGFNVVTKSIFSTQKLEKLGWHPLFSIEDGLKHTVDECKKRKHERNDN